MGIQGLIPMLKEISTSIHVKNCRGQTYAVDAYVWLHRGAYGCAEELALGKKTVKYVNYAMHRVRMLKYHGVTPLIVFDGGLLPSKMGTEGAREKRRTDALAKGNAFLAEGKKTQARDCFVKAVDITPEMAYQLIKALRREGIQYIVAPYEADPQLAYLERHGFVDGIITEDSDLLVFGCQNVLFKLDGDGNCVQIKRKDFAKCREFNFAGWSETEFRQMAILSGCDYIGSIVGMGLKRAYKYMKKYKTVDRVIQAVRLEGQLKVPENYFENFKKAELTFCHQLVFDPATKTIVHFQPLPPGMTSDQVPFAGAPLEIEFARGLARGDIDPLSKLPIIDTNPDQFSPTKNHVPSTFKPTKSASLLNYFQRQSVPAVASTSKVQLTSKVKVVPYLPKKRNSDGNLVPVEKGKGKEKENLVASKFFGGGKGKEKEVEKKPIEVVEIEDTEEEGEEEEEEFPDDLPTEYDESEWDEDAQAHLDEIEVGFGRFPSFTVEDDGDQHPSLFQLPFSPINRLELSSSVGISSPDVTPKKRRKLSSQDSFQEGEEEKDEGIEVKGKVDAEGSQSTGVVTSPFNSVTYDQVEHREDDEEDEDDEGMSSPSGSPTPTSNSRIMISEIKVEKVIKSEQVSTKEFTKGGLVVDHIMTLSSDPIEMFSEPALYEDGISEVSTLKATRKKKEMEMEAGRMKNKLGDVKPKIKVEKKPAVTSQMEEEGDENLPSVAALWRERFMRSSSSGSSSLTPKAKPKLTDRTSIVPLNIINPLSSQSKPLPTLSRKTTASLTKVPTLIKVVASRSRIPLSPKKSFNNERASLGFGSFCPPAGKENEDDDSRPDLESSTMMKEEKFVVTNKALLRFAYKG